MANWLERVCGTGDFDAGVWEDNRDNYWFVKSCTRWIAGVLCVS